jgi:hypothetical protein
VGSGVNDGDAFSLNLLEMLDHFIRELADTASHRTTSGSQS